MEKTIKILSYIGKAVGLVASIDLTPMNPKWGPIIFFVASLVKDSVNRVIDFMDNGKVDGSYVK